LALYGGEGSLAQTLVDDFPTISLAIDMLMVVDAIFRKVASSFGQSAFVTYSSPVRADEESAWIWNEGSD
jgi:hypothetical protein